MRQTPQIYEATASAIDGYSIGSLPDALSCQVTEERNGEFYLKMSYPANGLNAGLITVGRIIAALPNMYGNMQGFRIATIEKSLDGTMDVTAYHVSYDLSQVIVMPFTAATLADALDGLELNAVPANGFSLSSDMTKTATFTVSQPTPLRSLLVGTDGSLVDTYGGELRFDNWSVELLASRGQSRNVQIAYGKNLTGFKETDEIASYDAVVPFAVWNETTYVLTDPVTYPTAPIVYADGAGAMYGYPKAVPLDLSDKFSDDAPTEAELYAYAQSYIRRNSSAPSANYSTEYLDLAKLVGNVERVDLCDTVYITVIPFNVRNLTAKVISITYDALLNENSSVEVGDRRITLADTLAETIAAAEQKGGPFVSGDQIPFIVGTQQSATNKWTGNAPFSALKVGQGIRYKLPVAGNSSAATLKLTLAGGSETGEIPIRRLADSTVTTTYAAGCVILMTYDGTYWKCDAYVTNSNSIGYQLRTNSGTLPASAKFYRYRLLFTSADGTKWVPANTSTSTNATAARAVNQTPIDPFGEIVYYGSTTAIDADANVTATVIWQQYTLTLGYSFNRTGAALVLPYPSKIYLKCAPQADGSAIMDDTTPYVFALPTAQDHKIYIELGIVYSATQIELKMKHPVYYHDGTGIRQFTGGVI